MEIKALDRKANMLVAAQAELQLLDLELAPQNQSSGDASTSPAVLCERARRPSRLAEDGSLHGH